VILLTRLNGPVFALNPDLLERADCTPDTVITLVDGTKYVVAESLPDLVALIRQYRACVVAEAQQLAGHPAGRRDDRAARSNERAAQLTVERGGHSADTAVSRAAQNDIAAQRGGQRGEAVTTVESATASSATNVVQMHRRER
jgi:flagellar protein FlbD